MAYTVDTDLYEGPLALLVELARHNLLDVFLVKLQALTAQYLALVKAGGTTINELAEPLPLLGQLLALKARLLLPQPPPVEEEEIPISLEELQRRLAQYEQFKNVAQVLAQLHALQHQYFSRMRPSDLEALASAADQAPAGTDRLATPGEAPAGKPVGLLDLMTAFSKVLERAQGAVVYEIQQDAWTVEMKVQELTVLLSVRRQVAFTELFAPEKSRLELVVIFLALLELVRQRVCLAMQQETFGDILIIRREAHGPSARQTDP